MPDLVTRLRAAAAAPKFVDVIRYTSIGLVYWRESTPAGEIGSLGYPLVWVTGWQYPTRKWWFRLWGEPGGWGPLCPSVLPSRQAAIRAGLLALADRDEATDLL